MYLFCTSLLIINVVVVGFKSFRFGPEIAHVASSVLKALKDFQEKTLEGVAGKGECYFVVIINVSFLLICFTLKLFLTKEKFGRMTCSCIRAQIQDQPIGCV